MDIKCDDVQLFLICLVLLSVHIVLCAISALLERQKKSAIKIALIMKILIIFVRSNKLKIMKIIQKTKGQLNRLK